MRIRWTSTFVASTLSVLCVNEICAQQADVIRGRVTNEGKAVQNATVQATSIPNNVNKTATTDKSGRFTITFPNGDGDYWISFTSVGYSPKRFELKRLADEVVLVADANIERNAEMLETVRVRADRARAARNGGKDEMGVEKIIATTTVDPSQSGSIAALASSVPGVQLIPGAEGNPDQFSVFGLSGDQNNSTLNGLGFGGNDVPRDAATRSSLGTTLWDVSRGGFSGAQLTLKTQSGSNFSSRAISTLANAPQLEWTDRSGRALGAQYSSLSAGAATAGPIKMNKSFYSVGYQYDKRYSDLPTLSNANDVALSIAGVATDSVARLRDIIARAGVPLTANGVPSSKINERGLILAAFDLSPPTSTSGQSLNVTATGTFNRVNAPFAQVTGLGTNDARIANTFGAVQARHTNYLGSGVLTESTLGVTANRIRTDPYLQLPNGIVRVASTLNDGSTAITGLSFGGSRTQTTSNTSLAFAAQNQLMWFSLNNKHSIKLSSDLRYENAKQDITINSLGQFAYNSLADLSSGNAFSFTRLLTPRMRDARQLVGGISLGDTFRPLAKLQLQYGVRVDGNRYLTTPSFNGKLDSVFSIDNARFPNRLYVSPRVGFSWTYGEARQLAVANGFVRSPGAIVSWRRGSVSEFNEYRFNWRRAFQHGAGKRRVAIELRGNSGPGRELECVSSEFQRDSYAVRRWQQRNSFLE